jgi:hypothetical protein
MGVTIQDTELLLQFRDPETKEKAFHGYYKEIPGKAVLAYPADGSGA